MCSIEISNINKNKPEVTFDKNSGTAAKSHSVVITVSDIEDGLAANQNIKYRWQTDGTCSTVA
jgi:phosphopantetheinyl transferase (holo-ACP synthase)